MSHETILYDLPSKGRCCSWSLNPWKARLALNYKNIPYKTEWVEYPDIKPKFQSFGIPPNPSGASAEYSIPAARLADGSYIMDSHAIVKALEKQHPEPSLHYDNGYTDRVQSTIQNILYSLAPIGMPRIPEMVLTEASRPYFLETREKRFGMPLPELAKSDRAGENAWKKAEEPIAELKAIMHENADGPYVMGKQVSFADFIIAGFWRFIEKIDVDGDLYGRAMKTDPAFKKHYEACEKWLERDD